MVLYKYKIYVERDLVYIILGLFLQIIYMDLLILTTTILKSPWSPYHILKFYITMVIIRL